MFPTLCVFLGALDKNNKTQFPLPLSLQVNENIYLLCDKYYYSHSNYEYYGRVQAKLILGNDG